MNPDKLTAACYSMAQRFHRGGTLLTFGCGRQMADAQHITVEFVHPVIVGTRALPSICLANDGPGLSATMFREGTDHLFDNRVRSLAGPDDIALAVALVDEEGPVARALVAARETGALTIALLGTGGGPIERMVDHALLAQTSDPRAAREAHVTAYHLLWETTHLFLEHPRCLSSGVAS